MTITEHEARVTSSKVLPGNGARSFPWGLVLKKVEHICQTTVKKPSNNGCLNKIKLPAIPKCLSELCYWCIVSFSVSLRLENGHASRFVLAGFVKAWRSELAGIPRPLPGAFSH